MGFDHGGILTDKIDHHPHAVVLLDEIEKAHSDVFNILLQIMDRGKITDNNGKEIDCKNIILIMTSNVGAFEMGKNAIGFEQTTNTADASNEAINKLFTPEFRNRLDAIIPFAPLTMEQMHSIVDKNINILQNQLNDKKITLILHKSARNFLARAGFDEKMGARALNRAIDMHVKTPLMELILNGKLENGGEVAIEYKANKIALRMVPPAITQNKYIALNGWSCNYYRCHRQW